MRKICGFIVCLLFISAHVYAGDPKPVEKKASDRMEILMLSGAIVGGAAGGYFFDSPGYGAGVGLVSGMVINCGVLLLKAASSRVKVKSEAPYRDQKSGTNDDGAYRPWW